MPDFRTSLEMLVSQNHRRQPADIDQATLALINSMIYHRSERFWFNESTFLWQMTEGTYEYKATWDPLDTSTVPLAPPNDIFQPVSIQIQVGQNWWDAMDRRDMKQLRNSVFFEGNIGYPDMYVYFDDSFWFYSIPQDDFPCRIDYIADRVGLRATYDGTAWLFEYRGLVSGSPAWIDLATNPTFENEFLTHAEPMIRAWARWNLQNGYYKDKEAAEFAYAEYQSEKARMFTERDRRHQGDTKTLPIHI